MSGGFFRGTSADQDTRFSNKQAKLMKSQKFPAELEHLVEMTKVKMDVMKPWIATRVTELIGFEDEVLINFIYGLLDKKVVNGKEIQISLTGFMERNTGKFMKELWSLLLSAQQNASGVPQQFLDAKEEATRKKKAETDRIENEIQMKKENEKREKEEEINKKMDGHVDIGRNNDASLEPSKHQSRASSRRPVDEREPHEKSGSRGRSRSPRSADHSPSPRHGRSRSPSKSFSNSSERLRSRSISKSPKSRGRSVSLERTDRSLPRRSISPRRRPSPRRYMSPPRRRSSHSRRRSVSPLRYRSPSPARYRRRSPIRRRSRSPMRRRTRSPMRRRSISPSQSRSQSPVRRRSPYVRRRSRSPIRRRSPVSFRRRSPSPPRRRYQRSPSTPRRRSPSPVRRRSPLSGHKRLVSPIRRRSPSPRSPAAARGTSPSPVRRISPKGNRRSPAHSSGERIRSHGKYSPTRYSSPSEDVDHPVNTFKGSNTLERQFPNSLRSPQRDLSDRSGSLSELPPPPHRSRSVSESPPTARKTSPGRERSRVSHEVYVNQKKDKVIPPESFSPPPKARQQKPHHDKYGSSAEAGETKYSRDARDKDYRSPRKVSPTPDKRKSSSDKVRREDMSSPERLANNRTSKFHTRSDGSESRMNIEVIKSERPSGRMDLAKNSDQRVSPATRRGTSSKRDKETHEGEGNGAHDRSQSLSADMKRHRTEPESPPKLSHKVQQSDRSGKVDSGSEESDKHRAKVKDKRKHKRSEREEIASDDGSSSDSHVEDRKEAKRRRKDEKRLKKEERRRRREERRRRKEEKRAEKRRLKSTDANSPASDVEKNNDGHSSDDEYVRKRDTRGRDIEETESEQKKLEIALREKALESLRAKKGISR